MESSVLHALPYLTNQKVLREAHVWSKLDHKNVLPFIGITTDFEVSISLVSKWMTMSTAHDYVQDKTVDPRPLVGSDTTSLQPTHPWYRSRILPVAYVIFMIIQRAQ